MKNLKSISIVALVLIFTLSLTNCENETVNSELDTASFQDIKEFALKNLENTNNLISKNSNNGKINYNNLSSDINQNFKNNLYSFKGSDEELNQMFDFNTKQILKKENLNIEELNISETEKNTINSLISYREKDDLDGFFEYSKNLKDKLLNGEFNSLDTASKERMTALIANLDAIKDFSNEIQVSEKSSYLSKGKNCGEAAVKGAAWGGLFGAIKGFVRGCATGLVLGFNPGSVAAGCMGGMIVGMVQGAVVGAIEEGVRCELTS